jgi:hypothetical protein
VASRKIKGYFTEIVEYAQPLSKGVPSKIYNKSKDRGLP